MDKKMLDKIATYWIKYTDVEYNADEIERIFSDIVDVDDIHAELLIDNANGNTFVRLFFSSYKGAKYVGKRDIGKGGLYKPVGYISKPYQPTKHEVALLDAAKVLRDFVDESQMDMFWVDTAIEEAEALFGEDKRLKPLPAHLL